MALAGCVTVLASVSRAAGLLCVVLGLSFACSPIPYNTTSDSPFARPVTPEDLYYEEAEQGPPRIEPGDSLEVVVRRGGGEERSLVTVRENGRVYVGSLDIEVKNLNTSEAEARITEQAATIIRNPRVEVSIKQKRIQLRKQRVFLLGGGIGGPGTGAFLAAGGAELGGVGRKTTGGQLIALGGDKELAALDESRVIPGDAPEPEGVSVDLPTLFLYCDRRH